MPIVLDTILILCHSALVYVSFFVVRPNAKDSLDRRDRFACDLLGFVFLLTILRIVYPYFGGWRG